MNPLDASKQVAAIVWMLFVILAFRTRPCSLMQRCLQAIELGSGNVRTIVEDDSRCELTLALEHGMGLRLVVGKRGDGGGRGDGGHVVDLAQGTQRDEDRGAAQPAGRGVRADYEHRLK